jgi:hypothetical protein
MNCVGGKKEFPTPMVGCRIDCRSAWNRLKAILVLQYIVSLGQSGGHSSVGKETSYLEYEANLNNQYPLPYAELNLRINLPQRVHPNVPCAVPC